MTETSDTRQDQPTGLSEQSQPAQSARKRTKTLLDYPIGNVAANSNPLVPEDKHNTSKKTKTMLDHAVLWDTVAKAAAEMEAKITQQLKERVNEPVKPPPTITQYKKAAPCSSTWVNNNPSERCGYCHMCQQHVYDFTGMEFPQAEELILKMEGITNAHLYKRADGKFLTRNCPVGLKRKRDLIFVSVGGCIFIALVLTVMLMMLMVPKSGNELKQQAQTNNLHTAGSKTTDSSHTPASTTQADHLTSSTSPYTFTTKSPSSVTATPTKSSTAGSVSTSSSSDDYGDYWQFPDNTASTTAEDTTTTGAKSISQTSGHPESQQQQETYHSGAPNPAADQIRSTGNNVDPNQAPVVQYYGTHR